MNVINEPRAITRLLQIVEELTPDLEKDFIKYHNDLRMMNARENEILIELMKELIKVLSERRV